jgi:hypothetical protein
MRRFQHGKDSGAPEIRDSAKPLAEFDINVNTIAVMSGPIEVEPLLIMEPLGETAKNLNLAYLQGSRLPCPLMP